MKPFYFYKVMLCNINTTVDVVRFVLTIYTCSTRICYVGYAVMI